VPPAGIGPAAHGLGKLQASTIRIFRDKERIKHFRQLNPSFIFRTSEEKQGKGGVYFIVC